MKRARGGVWRVRLATGLLLVLAPLAFVTAVECGLRAVDFGHASTLFRRVPGADAYTTNPDFAYRYFSRETRVRPAPLYFPAEKPEDGYRVFVVGGSAAFGDFMPEYGLARVLEVLLTERYPGVTFEVLNAAVAAINSHVVLPIVREAAGYDPDLVVFYLGNNEVVGPYGPGSVRTRTGRPGETPGLFRVRLGLWVRGLRLGQAIERGLAALGIGAASEARGTPGMPAPEDLMRALVRFDDPRLARTYGNFERNLQDMLEAATASGARVLVVAVGSNLRSFAPFGSLHGRDLEQSETAAFEAIYREGVALQERGDCAAALGAYTRAAAIDPVFAMLHFRRGTCLLERGRVDEARTAMVLARDLDAGRYRADTTLNDILREEAEARKAEGVGWLDGERRFAESGIGPFPIPGDESFYDHVHLTFEGTYVLARAVLDSVEALLPAWVRDRAAGPRAPASAVADALALTPFDRSRLAALIAARHAQLGGGPGDEGRKRPPSSAFWREGGKREADSVEIYRRAIRRRPDDVLLRRNFATLLLARGDPAAAAEQLRVLVRRVPDLAEWRAAYGTALGREGRLDEARIQLETAVRLDPADFEARFQLAGVLQQLDRGGEAIEHYRRLLRAQPANPAVHFQLGALRFQRGELDAALRHFEAALQEAPGNAELHNAYGAALYHRGELQRSVAHLRQALRIDPQNAAARENLRLALQALRARPSPGGKS